MKIFFSWVMCLEFSFNYRSSKEVLRQLEMNRETCWLVGLFYNEYKLCSYLACNIDGAYYWWNEIGMNMERLNHKIAWKQSIVHIDAAIVVGWKGCLYNFQTQYYSLNVFWAALWFWCLSYQLLSQFCR